MTKRWLVLGIASAVVACSTMGPLAMTAPLEKTRWALTSLGPAETPIPKTANEPYLELGGEPGRVVGSGGCNRLAGPYELKGESLAFGPLAATKMACERGMDTEDAFHQALAKTASFRINGEELELRDASGALLATLEADDDPD